MYHLTGKALTYIGFLYVQKINDQQSGFQISFNLAHILRIIEESDYRCTLGPVVSVISGVIPVIAPPLTLLPTTAFFTQNKCEILCWKQNKTVVHVLSIYVVSSCSCQCIVLDLYTKHIKLFWYISIIMLCILTRIVWFSTQYTLALKLIECEYIQKYYLSIYQVSLIFWQND